MRTQEEISTELSLIYDEALILTKSLIAKLCLDNDWTFKYRDGIGLFYNKDGNEIEDLSVNDDPMYWLVWGMVLIHAMFSLLIFYSENRTST